MLLFDMKSDTWHEFAWWNTHEPREPSCRNPFPTGHMAPRAIPRALRSANATLARVAQALGAVNVPPARCLCPFRSLHSLDALEGQLLVHVIGRAASYWSVLGFI